MNSHDVRAGIRKSWELAKSIQLEEAFSFSQPYTPSQAFRDVCLNTDATYEHVYLTGLRNSDYNILLRDYAFLQFGITKEHHVRYAYYPNPFLGNSTDAVGELLEHLQEGLIDTEDYLRAISEIRKTQHPPLLRYENAPEQYEHIKHPCSHFHFGHHADNRWPVRRSLTPVAFSMLVLKHFYGAVWFSYESLKVDGVTWNRDDIITQERTNCRVVPDELFSAGEKMQFYID